MKIQFSVALCSMLLAGCSSDSSTTTDSNSEAQNTTLTGVFVDSQVGGVSYRTESQSGTTNKNGEYSYLSGEAVIFSIGSLDFPEQNGQQIITPISMSPSNSIEDNTAINIAVLLQSLDDDYIAENGINILPEAAMSASQLDFSMAPEDFSVNTDVVNFVANSGSVNSVVIDRDSAVRHLSNSTARSAEEIYAESRGLKQMTSEELQSVLNGNTLQWGDGSLVYYDGSEIRGLNPSDESLVGTINFANNLHCRNWGRSDKCSTVYDDGSGTLIFFVGGDPDSSGGYANVLIGNPEQL